MKVSKEEVQIDVTLVMIEQRGLVFLMSDRSKVLYSQFLKKSDQYKQLIRKEAKRY